ncbi:MAG: PKD domain-containing protein [Bacteroidia bacterium]|nr:choice-of-anchor J domain-containing protein [Bacteroidia bacterium]NNC86496.1 PKD domain-containing protein [Bacteroidia bacterium]NNM16620.1 PKD domain-containing protein [Bacteroidia bacterium]
MRKIYSFLIGFCLTLTAFTVQAQEQCISEVMFRDAALANPQLIENRNAYDAQMAEYIKNNPTQRTQGTNRVIPVVFHIIHTYGAENISKAQCLDQLRIMNEDFQRTNPDTNLTPAPFKAVAADCNIEFRLATKDPQGNCTDGIVRLYSPLTSNARNNVKALSYWPSNKYLNFWVVKTIENTSGSSGIVLGFAQFPGTGQNPNTDGIVCRNDYVGSIGSAAGQVGRTATHEVGHWLNLRHIWGDDGTACTGSDQVNDTPNQAGPNQSNCPSFPSISCSNSPNGDMFSNYMDYTADQCVNLFTAGQSARMNATLNSPISGRSNIWSQANLVATGTDDNANPLDCAPVADFDFNVKRGCVGTNITFTDASWGGPINTRTWDFPGGSPATSTSANPVVTYSTPGEYDVTLTVSNSTGTDTKSIQKVVTVLPTTGWFSAPFTEDFENLASIPFWYWFTENDNPTTNAWQISNSASVSGSNSVKLTNYTNNTGVDAFITPSVNLGNVSGTQMTFQLAHAARSSTGENYLRVYVSSNCGQTWSLRYTKFGPALSTAGIVSSNFTPSPADWRQETVNLSSSSISGKPNVIFKFEYTHENGNNIYIDDINIDGVVGLEELKDEYQVNLFPNPANGRTQLSFNLNSNADVKVSLEDLLGRQINVANEGALSAGTHNFLFETRELSSGIYMVKLNIEGQIITRKLIVE